MKLSRRHLLRGTAGIAIGLPLLEIMQDANAEDAPKRLLFGFGAISGGFDGGTPLMIPNQLGSNILFPESIAPFERIFDKSCIISDLYIPQAKLGVYPEAGERSYGINSFHYHMNPLFTGCRQVGSEMDIVVTGSTIDQIVAAHIGSQTPFSSLEYRVQADFYQTDSVSRGVLSYRQTHNQTIPMIPQSSPFQAYQNLIGTVQPANSSEHELWLAKRLQKQSVLDQVDRRMQGLMPKLSHHDKIRMEQHYDYLRDIELRLAEAYSIEGGICHRLEEPVEPAVNQDRAYSDETLRADLFGDIIAMAFGCDLTRSISLMITTMQSNLFMGEAIGYNELLHKIFHDGPEHATIASIAWHIEIWTTVLEKLDTLPEGNGSVLDNCAAVFLPEGGIGPLTPEESQLEYWSHSCSNMVAFISGNSERLLNGEHINANRQHPGSLLNAVLRSLDIETQFGEIESVLEDVLL